MTAPVMDGLVVIVAGASGAAGIAVCSELAAAGATVVGIEKHDDRLAAVRAAVPGLDARSADLSDPDSVSALTADIRSAYGRIDGLVHLIGGWRGGPRFTSNNDEDWKFLSTNLIDTLRYMTLAVHDDLAVSPAGRAVIVSATAVDNPTAGGANYATAKAAAETWMRSFADSLRRNQSGRKESPVEQTSAATVLVIKALVHDDMRAAEPEKTFAGFTDVADLARSITGLWSKDATELNGARISLAD